MALQHEGFQCAEADDPYAAIATLCQEPNTYQSVVLSLAGCYREELRLVEMIKRRLPKVDIWLSQTDGRQAMLAEALQLGADGLLGEDGLHRVKREHDAQGPVEVARLVVPAAPVSPVPPSPVQAGLAAAPSSAHRPFQPASASMDGDMSLGEPVLTAEELRALLQEQPSLSSGGEDED